MSEMNLIEELFKKALAEDIGQGDITTLATIGDKCQGRATIISKQNGVLAGITAAEKIFILVDEGLDLNSLHHDGDLIGPGDKIITISGRISSILTAERTALNFLAHLSGIASLTARFVDRVKSMNAQITDTRKTTPLLRYLEKKAVKSGGGANHRMGLFDMVLIKENHIEGAGGIREAIMKSKEFVKRKKLHVPIEVETTTLQEVREAISCGADRIMLDNMGLDEMREAVEIVAGRAEVEASGGVSLESVDAIAETGVDFISIGALTHSAPAFDFSLLLKV
jgi:nicotinate-nucleotide pyrophosphorylase (carboxylating)